MAVLSKGSFSLNLGLVKLEGDLEEQDRQCAWELYTELCTRIALVGKANDPKCQDFTGEVYIESLNSVYAFFQEARRIMRKFPVGAIRIDNSEHLGVLINRVLTNVLRPFLEKWHSPFRHWWEIQSNPQLPPFDRQAEYPDREKLLKDWTALRWLMRKLQQRLISAYKLVDVSQKLRHHA